MGWRRTALGDDWQHLHGVMNIERSYWWVGVPEGAGSLTVDHNMRP